MAQSVQNYTKLVISDPTGGSREFGFLAYLLKLANALLGFSYHPKKHDNSVMLGNSTAHISVSI